MRRTLTLYTGFLVQSLKARLAYKADFFGEILASVLGTAAGILFVVLLFHRIHDLWGWSREEVFFIYGLSLIPYGLFSIFSINLFEFPERYIIEGRFDRLLLRPMVHRQRFARYVELRNERRPHARHFVGRMLIVPSVSTP